VPMSPTVYVSVSLLRLAVLGRSRPLSVSLVVRDENG
jgi:hypothetical protein